MLELGLLVLARSLARFFGQFAVRAADVFRAGSRRIRLGLSA